LTPSKDPAINSTQQCIQSLNELASKLPERFQWLFRSVESLAAECQEIRPTLKDVLPLNRLYWEDALRNCEAYSIMATWRVVELARSCVLGLERRDLLCAALMARSALESTVQHLDFARKVYATLKETPEIDFRHKILDSEDFEKLLLKTIFASRMAGDDEIYKPINVLTIISRTSKIVGQENIASHYETLCEVAHPNFLGKTVHIHEIIPGSRAGDEVRILGPGQATSSSPIIVATVGALSWACGNHVSSFSLMRSTIAAFLKRFPTE
jgi:hypothetical protein